LGWGEEVRGWGASVGACRVGLGSKISWFGDAEAAEFDRNLRFEGAGLYGVGEAHPLRRAWPLGGGWFPGEGLEVCDSK